MNPITANDGQEQQSVRKYIPFDRIDAAGEDGVLVHAVKKEGNTYTYVGYGHAIYDEAHDVLSVSKLDEDDWETFLAIKSDQYAAGVNHDGYMFFEEAVQMGGGRRTLKGGRKTRKARKTRKDSRKAKKGGRKNHRHTRSRRH